MRAWWPPWCTTGSTPCPPSKPSWPAREFPCDARTDDQEGLIAAAARLHGAGDVPAVHGLALLPDDADLGSRHGGSIPEIERVAVEIVDAGGEDFPFLGFDDVDEF